MDTDSYQYANLSELLATTDIRTGNYVLPLYGAKIFIHQNPSTNGDSAKITAYQTDNEDRLHFIADIYEGQYVSQLSVSADARYFGFITIDDGITTGYVYYLDVLAKEIDIAHSWAYTNSPNPSLVFSQNGQFAIFSPGANKLQVKSLYSNEPEVVFDVQSADAGNGIQTSANTISIALGYDYIIWIQSNGKLSVIDLVPNQQPTEWPDTNIHLETKLTNCLFYNNYLIHIHHKDEKTAATIALLQINPINRTVTVSNRFEFPELGSVGCVPNLDGKSITLINYYKNRETRMSVLLPDISTYMA